MTLNPRILVVVPARAGSKGIPRKNVRLLHGRPLIGHALNSILQSKYRLDVWVSTDCPEVTEVAERLAVRVLPRPTDLAGDAVTLDPVIHHAVESIERQTGDAYEIVVTVQPTSPLLRSHRLDEAIDAILTEKCDTAITAVEDRHLRWRGDPAAPTPAFERRVNRQQMEPLFRETGAVVATRREFVSAASRFGPRVRLIPVTEQEAVDIDSYSDWWLADNYLACRRIAIRVDGGGALGLGHVYRAITLSSRLFNHDIRFFMDPALPEGPALAEAYGMRVVRTSPADLRARLNEFEPDLVVLDVLDTRGDFVRSLQDAGRFVVTFEDLGEGAATADLVFNSLYTDPDADNERRFCGPAYECLREEFYSVPLHPPRRDVREILVTFGGTDPSHLTLRALEALDQVPGEFEIVVVLGLGFRDHDALDRLLPTLRRSPQIIRNTRTISTYMSRADLAITSAGRTVFELIACQTPALVLAQNERELLHTSADERYGVRSLGLGRDLPVDTLAGEIAQLLVFARRAELRERMLKLDLWHGPERVLTTVFSRYEAWQRYRHAVSRERTIGGFARVPEKV